MSSNRKRAKEMKKAEEAAPSQPTDLDTVYRPELTGRDIDLIGNLIDAWVKSGGVQVVGVAMPLLEKVTASRRAALTGSKEKI
jgi:hypothetical protein